MGTHKKWVFLLVILGPALITITPIAGWYVWSVNPIRSILNIHFGYSNEYSIEFIEELANKTIHIKNKTQLAFSKHSPQEWILNTEPILIAQKEVIKPQIRLSKVGQSNLKLDISVPPIKIKQDESLKDRAEDPFIKSWLKNKQKSETLIATAPKPKDNFRGWTVVTPETYKREIAPVLIDDGKEKPVSILNFNPIEEKYLNYVTVEGKVEWPIQEDIDQYFSEVAFYDQVGEDGLDMETSTSLAAQEIRKETDSFSLRLPAESQGHVIAKLYALSDIDKKNPLYIGGLEKNPLYISKNGVEGLSISLLSKTKYLSKYQTLFSGRVLNEYISDSDTNGIADVKIWVAETGQYTIADSNGYFELKGLSKSSQYHFIFEKEQFITIQVPVKIVSKKQSHIFSLSPITKFLRGYDALLGSRDSTKAVLFATVTKDGKPLDRAIVKLPQSQKVIYEKNSDIFSLPDPGLFSSTESGKFILWNVKPGKQKIDIYQDGELIGGQWVKLSPGIVHHMSIAVN